MPWNETDRDKCAVIRQRYASELSDEEFALVQPLLPAPKSCGRKPTDPRAILNPKSGSWLIADPARIVGTCGDADKNPSSFGSPIG